MGTPTLNIIGCGKLGRTLGRLFSRAGVFEVLDLFSRSEHSARQASQFIGQGRAVAGAQALRAADVWLIATPDGEIAAAAAALAGLGVVPPGACAFHCSGARSSELLAPLAASGVDTASAHPVFSFAAPERAAEGFAGTFCGLEGAAPACARLRTAFAAIGGRCFAIDPRHKLLYHAGSVFASNFTVVLLDVALQAYREAGIDEETARELMRPLVDGAIANAHRLGPAAALSGPAARGDHDTIRAQHGCVAQWHADAGQAYAALSRLALDLAARAKR